MDTIIGDVMKNIIEIRNLKKNYGDLKAVDDISFDVEKGSLFAFLGLNGAGKSTTINMICQILKKDGGKIIVDGLDMDEKPNDVKSRIGVVFQNSTLDAVLSVKENLTVRAGFYGLKGKEWKARLEELTKLLDLKEILNKQVGRLSGGQRRRVDIARGLIHLPKILILDEPTTGLDPQTRKKIWGLIDELRVERKMTVFLTTHYMEEADKADRVVVIDHGKIVANDTPHKLKSKYTSDYIKIYMPQNEEFEKIFGDKTKYYGDYYRINIKDSDEAVKIIDGHKKFFSDFEILKGDMDDVFLNITGRKFKEDNDEK